MREFGCEITKIRDYWEVRCEHPGCSFITTEWSKRSALDEALFHRGKHDDEEQA